MQGILIRRGARIDAIRRIFEALIRGRVEKKATKRLDDRNRHLPRAGHIAAEDELDAIDGEQSLREDAVILGDRGRVIDDRLDRAIEDATRGIDFLDGQEGSIQFRPLDRCRHTRL